MALDDSSDIEETKPSKRALSTPNASPGPRKRAAIKPEPQEEDQLFSDSPAANNNQSDDEAADFFIRKRTFNFKSQVFKDKPGGLSQRVTTRQSQPSQRDVTPEARPKEGKVVNLDTSSEMSSTDDDKPTDVDDSPHTKKLANLKKAAKKREKERENKLRQPKLPTERELKPMDLPDTDSDESALQSSAKKKKSKRPRKPRQRAIAQPKQIDPLVLEAEQARLRADMVSVPKLLRYSDDEGPSNKRKKGKARQQIDSDIEIIEPDQDDDMDPALKAALARRTNGPKEAGSSQAAHGNGSSGFIPGLDKGSLITISVRMVGMADPEDYEKLDGQRKDIMRKWEIPVPVDVHTKESFDNLFQTVAKQKQMPASALILEHDQQKVFASQTPEMLRIFFSTELVGYKEDVYEQVLRLRTARLRSSSVASPMRQPEPEDDTELDGADGDVPPADNEEEEGGNPWDDLPEGSIGLRVRAKDIEPLELQVLKTSSVRAVLKHFLREHNMMDRFKDARLSFDGDELDLKSTIEESGAETDDVMDVNFVS